MKNESSNTGIYDQFPAVFRLIKPSRISLNKIKPYINEKSIQINKNIKKCSNYPCS